MLANLRVAQLGESNLSDARLHKADLTDANLYKANLNGAALLGTNLTGADLRGANLDGADLRGTDFTESIMGGTYLSDLHLDAAWGLETVRHNGPSSLGVDTIYASKGDIPVQFLRGVGVGDDLISSIKALSGTIQFYSCFISYSSRDHQFAERLYADLQSKGVRCWFAPEDLKIGDKLRPSFDEAIRLHDKLMVIISGNSANSSWVEKEVETAFEMERQQKRTVLFPIRLDDAVLETKQAWAADIRRTRHIGDFREWKNNDSYKTAFDRLLRDLKTEDKTEIASQNKN
jgi:uncharacterized protein YjbI with pentapeptide repeats